MQEYFQKAGDVGWWAPGGGAQRRGSSPILSPPTPGFLAPTSMFTFVVLVITIVICLCHVCFGHFKYLSAHNYKVWGEGGRGGLRAAAQGGAGEQGDGWELRAGAARVSGRHGVLLVAEGEDISPLPDSFWAPQD